VRDLEPRCLVLLEEPDGPGAAEIDAGI